MLKALPSIDLYVLDGLTNLYDHFGEEKHLSFDQVVNEVTKYCRHHSIQKIDI